MRLLNMDTVRSWGKNDLASSLAFFSQTEFQKNWTFDANDIILTNEAIWIFYGFLALITAISCKGEKFIQKAAVSLLQATYSNSCRTDGN